MLYAPFVPLHFAAVRFNCTDVVAATAVVTVWFLVRDEARPIEDVAALGVILGAEDVCAVGTDLIPADFTAVGIDVTDVVAAVGVVATCGRAVWVAATEIYSSF